jgi:predicted metal-binding membrane protein
MRTAALAWHILRSLPWVLLAASAAGWALLLLAQSQALVVPALCLSASSAGGWWESVRATLAFNPPERLALGWLVMLLAMMPLLLHRPLAHIWHRSLVQRRVRATALFVLGYTLVWLAAGAVLMLAAFGMSASDAGMPAFAMLVALVWQVAPFKQRFLNGCHRQPHVAAFGFAADADALRYGVTHGAWCVGSCWALMLLPLSAGSWHLPAMLAVSLVMMTERYRRPRLARWGLPNLQHLLPRVPVPLLRLRSPP